jgi:serralysin
VNVNLATGMGSGGDAQGDKLINIQNVTGSAFDDFLTGDSLNNLLIGGAGNDTLDGGPGADTMIGGPGNNTYYVDNVGDVVKSRGGGTDTVLTTLNNYTLPNKVTILTFIGSGDFTGTGNAAANVITGGAGNDILDGGGGNDTLIAGAGADTLTGGSGADQFVFGPSLVAGFPDVITDFNSAQGDKINLSLIDAIAGGGHDDFAFVGNNPLTGAGQLDYVVNPSGGVIVQGDVDGGGADFSIKVTNVNSLKASNFIL